MFLFYAPDISLDPILPEVESGHCVRVLRKQPGDSIDITDGKGHFFRAEIVDAHPKRCRVEILEVLPQAAHWQNRIELAVAPTKNMDRMEWLVEKATEVGIDRITFLKTRFSERKELKLERVEKIAIAAMKQSEKARLPILSGMIAMDAFLKQGFEGQKMIAHCYEGDKDLLSKAYRLGQDVLILIGPEGDFSREEVELARQAGFQEISLGKSRLRTETAALYACQAIHLLNQIER